MFLCFVTLLFCHLVSDQSRRSRLSVRCWQELGCNSTANPDVLRGRYLTVMAICDSYSFLKYPPWRKPCTQSWCSEQASAPLPHREGKDGAPQQWEKHSWQRAEGDLPPSGEADFPLCSLGSLLATLGGKHGWMLLPDADYGGFSCSLETSAFGVACSLVWVGLGGGVLGFF